jgi:hypothetical protein
MDSDSIRMFYNSKIYELLIFHMVFNDSTMIAKYKENVKSS